MRTVHIHWGPRAVVGSEVIVGDVCCPHTRERNLTVVKRHGRSDFLNLSSLDSFGRARFASVENTGKSAIPKLSGTRSTMWKERNVRDGGVWEEHYVTFI